MRTRGKDLARVQLSKGGNAQTTAVMYLPLFCSACPRSNSTPSLLWAPPPAAEQDPFWFLVVMAVYEMFFLETGVQLSPQVVRAANERSSPPRTRPMGMSPGVPGGAVPERACARLLHSGGLDHWIARFGDGHDGFVQGDVASVFFFCLEAGRVSSGGK